MSQIQFKLSNGDEIICQVIDEPEGEDINIVVRHAMKIITEDKDNGYRYYSFRPWMVYQDHKDFMQLINYTHIVGEAKPSPLLLEQYNKAVQIEQENASTREEEILEKMDQVMEQLRGMECNDSDDEDNIVALFKHNKDTMH